LNMYQIIGGAILSAIMIASSILLTWRWSQVVHGSVDFFVVFYTSLLITSLSLLLLLILYVMKTTVEEIESAKRVTSIGYREIEERLVNKISRGLREIEDRLSDLERRIYR